MSVAYLDLADYVAIAAEVTGLDVDTIMRIAKLNLADSALHAPVAGFGETEFYPDFVDKAAVLVVRLAKNHPLPDGNKRAAWVTLRLFVEINGWSGTRHPASKTLNTPSSRSPPATGAKTRRQPGSANT
ncbi:MAG TPA: Fic family protein [Solirubrobacteraceae bacterium]|nr:Fic family protein [Solirubrobacteraceae bacterium]